MTNDPPPAMPVVLDVRIVTGSGGGPDKTILNSPRFLAESGYHNPCAYLHPPGDPGFQAIVDRAQALKAPLISIDDRGPVDWRVVGQLRDICRREKVAIWHGHDYKSNLLGLIVRRWHPMKLVTTMHGWVERTLKTPLYYAVDRLCLPRYERVICVSDDLHAAALKCGVRPDRTTLIENGIDTRTFVRDRSTAEAKASLGFPPDRLLIGAVGRLSAEKGFDLLIDAVDRLVRDGLDFSLAIAGDGAERSALQTQIDRLGRGDRFRLLGFRADVGSVHQALDIYALSSRREGLPNVLLEAMAYGVPVVATRIAGIPRLIRDRDNGLIVAPESVDELAGALRLLAENPALRASIGGRGRSEVETRYDFSARMQKISRLYDEILGRSPAHLTPRPGNAR